MSSFVIGGALLLPPLPLAGENWGERGAAAAAEPSPLLTSSISSSGRRPDRVLARRDAGLLHGHGAMIEQNVGHYAAPRCVDWSGRGIGGVGDSARRRASAAALPPLRSAGIGGAPTAARTPVAAALIADARGREPGLRGSKTRERGGNDRCRRVRCTTSVQCRCVSSSLPPLSLRNVGSLADSVAGAGGWLVAAALLEVDASLPFAWLRA